MGADHGTDGGVVTAGEPILEGGVDVRVENWRGAEVSRRELAAGVEELVGAVRPCSPRPCW